MTTAAIGAVLRVGLFAVDGAGCSRQALRLGHALAEAGVALTEPGQACDLLVTALASPADVDALLAGPGGGWPSGSRQGAMTAGSSTPCLVVEMGMLAPREVQAAAARLLARGVDMLDVSQVAEGALRAGGSAAAFERARPLLSRLGSDLRHVGAIGTGRAIGCCHSILDALTTEAVAEALTLARRLGADPSRVRAALAGGFAASHVLDVHGARMLSRDFAPALEAGVAADALGVVIDEAHALGLDLPGSALVAQQLNALVGAGDAGLDSSALVKVLERMAGETL